MPHTRLPKRIVLPKLAAARSADFAALERYISNNAARQGMRNHILAEIKKAKLQHGEDARLLELLRKIKGD